MDLETPILKNIPSGQLIRIDKSPFTIGRGLIADLVIESRVVSRTHCTLEKIEGDWTLTDSSTNGTLVNDELYKGAVSAKLKHNDEISLGLNEFTYKFLFPDESAPNSQIQRLRREENHNPPANESIATSRPHSRSSFDENGISDDVLNNLADDLLRKSQENKENKSEDENQPSTSSNLENTPVIDEAQVALPTSSNQEQNLNSNNNPIEQNDLLERPRSSAEAIIDLEHDYRRDIPKEEPGAIIIDITDDALKPSSSSTNSTSNRSGLVHPITIDITDDDDNITTNSDTNSNSSSSTITYSLPDELQSNSYQSLPISSMSSNIPPRLITCTPFRVTQFCYVASAANDFKRIRMPCLTTSNRQTLENVNTARVTNPNVSSTTTEHIAIAQADSSVNAIEDQVANPGRIQDSATTTDLPQKTETQPKCPSETLQHSQQPGTSKDSNKFEEMEPNKQSNQGVDQNKFEEMENELMCIICSNLFVKAVTLGCSHSFCQHCIESWKKNKTDCPVCRTKMVSSIRTLVLDNVIEKMMENATEEEKKLRREVVEERQKIADAANAAKNQQQPKNANRNAREREIRNRRRGRRIPPPPVEQPLSDSQSSSDSNRTITEDSDDELGDEYYHDDWYDRREGAYYGGYGRCYVCGEPGHWANGCPYR